MKKGKISGFFEKKAKRAKWDIRAEEHIHNTYHLVIATAAETHGNYAVSCSVGVDLYRLEKPFTLSTLTKHEAGQRKTKTTDKFFFQTITEALDAAEVFFDGFRKT